MDRQKATPRDRSRRAQARRLRYLRANPLCAACLAEGRTSIAAELDHVIPLMDGGPDDETNYQGLCVPCHVQKSRLDRGLEAKHLIGKDGWPVELPPESPFRRRDSDT